jgi:hypothetical protein
MKVSILMQALLLCSVAAAQSTFLAVYPVEGGDDWFEVSLELPGSAGFAAAGYYDVPGVSDGLRFLRTDRYGNVLADVREDYGEAVASDCMCMNQNQDLLIAFLSGVNPCIEWRDWMGDVSNGVTYTQLYQWFPWSICTTFDGGYVLAGVVGQVDSGFVMKVGPAGALEWTWKIPDAEFHMVRQHPSGNYAACGTAFSESDLGWEGYMTELDPDGNPVFDYWHETSSEGFNGISAFWDYYVMCDSDGDVVCIDGSGTLTWSWNLPDARFYSLCPTPEGDVAVTGDYLWDVVVARMPVPSSPDWILTYGEHPGTGACIHYCTDGGFVVAGAFDTAPTPPPEYDSFILKVDGDGYYGPEGVDPGARLDGMALSVTPNPAADGFTATAALASAADVSIGVYDLAGRLAVSMFDGTLGQGIHEFTGEGLGTGLYLVRLASDGETRTSRLTILR